MGKSQKGIWGGKVETPSPWGSKPSPKVATKEKAEKKEVPKGSKPVSFEDYSKKAEKLSSDPNTRAAERIHRLSGNTETVKQLEGLTALNTALVSILTKLAKKDVDIEKIRTPEQLKLAVTTSGITLNLPESTALENLDRIASGSGQTANEVRNSWPDRIKTAQEASKGFGDKYKEYLKKNPVGTIALTVAGATGIYLTFLGIKALVKKAFATDADKKGGSWFKKEIMIPVAIAAAGTVIGKEPLKKILTSCGLDYFKVEEKVKKGKKFTKKEEDKLKKAGKKIKRKIDELRRHYGLTPAVPGALETKEDSNKLKEFGVDLLIIKNSALALADGTYMYLTGDTKTYFRFENGKWEWASEWQKKADKWVATGGNYYGDKNKYKEVNEIAKKLAGKTEKPAETAVNKTKEAVSQAAGYEVPRDLLVQAYCYNKYEYPPGDIIQIHAAIDFMRDKKISEVQSLWRKYKNKKKIPHKNALGEFSRNIPEKDIYTAVMIIGNSAEEYKKHVPNIDYTKLTLKEFFKEHINKDYIFKIYNALNTSIIDAIEKEGLVGAFTGKIKDLNLDNVEKELEVMGKNTWEDLAADFDINLAGIDKAGFASILFFLYRNASLNMSADQVFKLAGIPKSNEKTTAAVKAFYKAVQKKTLTEIIPAAVKRFNLDEEALGDKENADIIKNSLNDTMPFNRATYLCMVTRRIDLNKPADKGSSALQEFAFLFTVLSSIPPAEKAKYVSELSVLMLKYPDKFPSLQLLCPIFRRIIKFGLKYAKEKLKAIGYWVSAWTRGRSEERQQAFLKKMRHTNAVNFGTEAVALGATKGSLSVAMEIIGPLIDSGKVTLEELGDCENALDFMLLIKKAGGTFIYSEDENGKPQGLIHFMGDVFWFRPKGIVKETFSAALHGEYTGAFKVWTAGSIPFVIYGAVHGYLMAHWSIERKGWLTLTQVEGATGGAVKQLLGYPYYALRTTYRASKTTVSAAINAPVAVTEYAGRPTQTLRRLRRGVGDLIRYRSPWPGQNVPNMLENGRKLEKYMEGGTYTDLKWKEWFHKLRNNPKELAQRLAWRFNDRMAVRYSVRFADDYNHFFDFDKSSPDQIFKGRILKGEVDEIGRAKTCYFRMKRFLEKTNSADKTFDKMRGYFSSGLKNDKLRNKLYESLKKIGELTPGERQSLAKQLLTGKDVTRLQQRMKDGFKIFSDAGKAKRSTLFERLRPRNVTEKARSFGKAETALRQTEKNLTRAEKQIASAEKKVSRLKDVLTHNPDDAVLARKNLEAAEAVLKNARISGERLKVHKFALQWVKEAEKELKLLKDTELISQKQAELRNATVLAEKTMEDSSMATQRLISSLKLSKTIKSATGLKWLEVLKIANNEATVLETSAKFGKIAKTAKKMKDTATAFARTPKAIKALNDAIKKAKALRKATDALEAAKKTKDAAKIARATANLEKSVKTAKTASDTAKGFTSGSEAAKAIDKAVKAARKSAEALAKMNKAETTAKAAKEAAMATRKGYLTAEEAVKLGGKIESIASRGGKVIKFIRVGGRVFAVVDAAMSVYDVYDQACELGKILSDEYVETGDVFAAMDKISTHTGRMAESQRLREEQANLEIIRQRNLKKKLRGARNLAIKLKSHASSYGISRRTVSGDSTLDKIWDTLGAVGGGLTYLGMAGIYGGNDFKLKEAEDMLIQTDTKQGREILTQLSAIRIQTDEVKKTIDALTTAIRLAVKAIKEDKPCSDGEIDELSKKIRQAQTSVGKKV